MSDLEPDISVSERTRRIAKDAIKACEGFLIFPLLFIDDPESEEYFVGFIKILITQVSKTRREIGRSQFTFVHAENGRESFLSMVEGTIAIIKNAYTVP
jgi:hypothetical protein